MKIFGKKCKKLNGVAMVRYYEDDVAFAGFLDKESDEFIPMMRIRSDEDMEKFMKKHNVNTVVGWRI